MGHKYADLYAVLNRDSLPCLHDDDDDSDDDDGDDDDDDDDDDDVDDDKKEPNNITLTRQLFISQKLIGDHRLILVNLIGYSAEFGAFCKVKM